MWELLSEGLKGSYRFVRALPDLRIIVRQENICNNELTTKSVSKKIKNHLF